MSRSHRTIAAGLARCGAVVLVATAAAAGLGAEGAARADALDDLMKAQRSPGQGSSAADDAARVEELRKLLKEAVKLQEQQLQQEKAGGAPAKAGSPNAKPASDATAPAAAPEDAPAAAAQAGKAGKAGKAGEPAPPAARPGCMYSGSKLIWEKDPGTCSKHP